MRTKTTVDTDEIRRFGSFAKALEWLADCCERMRTEDVFRDSFDDSVDMRLMQLPLYLDLTSQDGKLVIDLARLPHLLVGGASGQGKSNLLNCIICGLAQILPPEQLRFILFDPKYVEFAQYSTLPHLAFPVITDGVKFVYVLHWLVWEMEKRLKEFARATCRNIEDYRNAGNQIPYLVVIIDELADLMRNFGKEIEPLIALLTSYARATGIHLVIATQVADHKVLSASLRSNLPGRIAFKTRSKSDSMMIIDAPDADVLCAPGDMLVRQKDGTLTRAQCAYLSGEEESRIIEAVEKQYGRPKFLASLPDVVSPTITEPQPAANTFSSNVEEIYDHALELVSTTGKASIPHFQRRLKIGYFLAARILDLLEERGVIGPADGTHPREILI